MTSGRRATPLAAVVAALIVGSTWLDAHEFWITVTPSMVAVGDTAPFGIGFGERFQLPTPLPEAREIPIRIFSPSGAPVPLRGPTRITPDGLLVGSFPGGSEPGVYTVDASLYAKPLNYSFASFTTTGDYPMRPSRPSFRRERQSR